MREIDKNALIIGQRWFQIPIDINELMKEDSDTIG
jgi:hypothetical protein